MTESTSGSSLQTLPGNPDHTGDLIYYRSRWVPCAVQDVWNMVLMERLRRFG